MYKEQDIYPGIFLSLLVCTSCVGNNSLETAVMIMSANTCFMGVKVQSPWH